MSVSTSVGVYRAIVRQRFGTVVDTTEYFIVHLESLAVVKFTQVGKIACSLFILCVWGWFNLLTRSLT